MINQEIECNNSVLSQPAPNDDDKLHCEALWDTWGCWNYTLAGTTASIPCPGHINGFDTSLRAYRVCNPDGTWWVSPDTNNTWANYTSCINQDELNQDKRQAYLFILGYAVSILFLIVSQVVFMTFRQLHCDRVTVHKNLFTSYILNGIAWILYYSIVAMDFNVQMSNPVWCQMLHVVTQYFVHCNFFWMFCEGFYLHMIIVMAFMASKKLLVSCYIIGWGIPLIFTTTYTIVRGLRPEESNMCWAQDSHLQWVIAVPIVVSIIVNLSFLFNILRVLFTKLRAVNTPDANNSRKAAKAILILIPLLGIQFVVFPIKLSGKGIMREVYLYAVAIIISFQGLFVSLILCFFNGEVYTVLKRRWGQHQLMTRNAFTPRSSFAISSAEQNVSFGTKSSLKKQVSNQRSGSRHFPMRILNPNGI